VGLSFLKGDVMPSSFETVNPYTKKVLATYTYDSAQALESKLRDATREAKAWANTPLSSRLALVEKLSAVLEKRKTELAELASMEMGKVLAQSLAEVEKCAAVCQFYAENGEAWLTRKEINTAASLSYQSYQPLGVILGIMPWNFPYWQVCRFVAPTLAAGNAVLIKHSTNTQGCAEALMESFLAAGFPKGLVQTISAEHDVISDMIADKRIHGVSLTGSTRAGKAVGAAAGKALKPVVLELGGSDAYIINADCDLDHAIETLITARLINCGQSCISPKRLLVERPIYERFVEGLTAGFASYKLGDPLKEETKIGPMARKDLSEELAKQVSASLEKGASLCTGGRLQTDFGFAYEPTVLKDVLPGQPAFDDELFGPVAAITPFTSTEDAVALANQSIYGLGGGVFSRDLKKAAAIADQLECGFVAINDFVRSDPKLPFGGIKESGIGRELSVEGLYAFTNIKTYYFK